MFLVNCSSSSSYRIALFAKCNYLIFTLCNCPFLNLFLSLQTHVWRGYVIFFSFWWQRVAFITESQNDWGGGHLIQPPWWSRFSQRRLQRIISRQVLNICRDGNSTASLASLFKCSGTLTGKLFSILRWNPCNWATLEGVWHLPLYLYTLMRSLLSCVFSRLNRPSSLCLSSLEMLQTPNHFCGLCFTLFSNSLSYLTGHSTPYVPTSPEYFAS